MFESMFCGADSKRDLMIVLLSEFHENTRVVCSRFLERLASLDSIAHQWVLQLLSESMQEADSKPQYCLQYYEAFVRILVTLSKQSLEVNTCTWYDVP